MEMRPERLLETIIEGGICRWPHKYDYCRNLLHTEEKPEVKVSSHVHLDQHAVEKKTTVTNIDYVRDGQNRMRDSQFSGFVTTDLLLRGYKLSQLPTSTPDKVNIIWACLERGKRVGICRRVLELDE